MKFAADTDMDHFKAEAGIRLLWAEAHPTAASRLCRRADALPVETGHARDFARTARSHNVHAGWVARETTSNDGEQTLVRVDVLPVGTGHARDFTRMGRSHNVHAGWIAREATSNDGEQTLGRVDALPVGTGHARDFARMARSHNVHAGWIARETTSNDGEQTQRARRCTTCGNGPCP